MTHMTLMTGPERRRRWSFEERRRILAVAFSPDAVVADVSRQYDVSTSLIYKWRRPALSEQRSVAFAPAVLMEEPASLSPRPEMVAIRVELSGGARVRIGAAAPAALVTATLRALR